MKCFKTHKAWTQRSRRWRIPRSARTTSTSLINLSRWGRITAWTSAFLKRLKKTKKPRLLTPCCRNWRIKRNRPIPVKPTPMSTEERQKPPCKLSLFKAFWARRERRHREHARCSTSNESRSDLLRDKRAYEKATKASRSQIKQLC